jgi:hypothetical protein
MIFNFVGNFISIRLSPPGNKLFLAHSAFLRRIIIKYFSEKNREREGGGDRERDRERDREKKIERERENREGERGREREREG